MLAPFHQAEKPASRWRVGTEAEKLGVRVADGAPVPYEGETGVRAVLAALADRHGWRVEREHEAGEVIALRRGDASITLEPGGQLELSGAPLRTIHETCAEIRGHMEELRDISDELGIAWLGLGFHPLATQRELPWVPKLRYAIMREYLPTRGAMGLDMMRRTATVQANFDYASEADAARKLRVSLAIAPIVGAMFANSPFVEGRATGERSRRARVWLDVDPDRTGLLPFAWRDDFGYRDYVEWALDVPMFGFKRGGELVANTGQPFRAFLKDGYRGHEATTYDWQTHLNTLFPEVRLKNILEIRCADSQATAQVCALPALLQGILYDERALDAAQALVRGLDHDAVQAARAEVPGAGLRARLAGRELAEWASELLAIAEGGLERLAHLDADGRDERIHLASLRALVERGATPADALLEEIDPERPLLPQLLASERARLL